MQLKEFREAQALIEKYDKLKETRRRLDMYSNYNLCIYNDSNLLVLELNNDDIEALDTSYKCRMLGIKLELQHRYGLELGDEPDDKV